MVFWLVKKCISKRWDSLLLDDDDGQLLIESSDETKSHDAWKSCVSLGLRNVINNCSCTSCMHYHFSEFRGMFSNLSDASSSILSHLDIHILQAVKDLWEDVSFSYNFCQVDCMLGNMSEARTDLSFELSIWVRDQSRKVGDCPLVNYLLS